MIYITGDKHADFSDVYDYCCDNKTSLDDILIVLGDAGINYYADDKDFLLKNSLLQYPITLFCIHGNHEERPENIKTYKTKIFHNGIVYYEEEYPNILFAKDGEIYDFNGSRTLVIGGAYSVDKDFRLLNGYRWYSSEQPNDGNDLVNYINSKKIIDDIFKEKKLDLVIADIKRNNKNYLLE